MRSFSFVTSGIVVLIYHFFEDESHSSGIEKPDEKAYMIHIDSFRNQMKYLKEHDFQVITLDELSKNAVWTNRGVIITIDDGHDSIYSLALPVLNEFGFKAELFITTDWIDSPDYLSAARIKELSHKGMEIGSHAKSHKFLDDLDESMIAVELSESKSKLSSILGRTIETLAIPGGKYNKRVLEIAKTSGYKRIFTSKCSVFGSNDNWCEIPRFTIMRDTSFDEFKKIVNQNPMVRWRKGMRDLLREILIGLFGKTLFYKIQKTRFLLTKHLFHHS